MRLTNLTRSFVTALSFCLVVACSAAQRSVPAGAVSACTSPAACEERASARLEALRNDPTALTAFLRHMPKGSDLHNHLSGAVYAESYIAWAREDGFRLAPSFELVDAAHCPASGCTDLPTSDHDPRWNEIVHAWSMEGFVPGAESGHDHFFAAFGRFGAVSHEARRMGDMLAEAMRRAADDGAFYLEIMVTVVRPEVDTIAHDTGTVDAASLASFAQRLRADPRWSEAVTASQHNVGELEDSARAVLRCDTPTASPACALTVRYIGQVGRTGEPAQVFAQLLANYEVGAVEPRLVGVNLVSPEDNPTALRDYTLQMSMIGFLGHAFQGRSPLRVTLHAGELTPALIPAGHPEALRSHIREAVEIAHAERIGHGVDVLGETDAPGLLTEMHQRGVTVEICLSSNNTILGVSGAAHPLSAYLHAGVPTVLATDDAGVSRSSLTGEFVRAVTAQGVTYPQLKAMVRQNLTAAFVQEATRAQLQDTLERQFQDFERALPPG